jgi:SRSO17 transposase
MTSPGSVQREAADLDELLDRIGRRFARVEPRLRAREFVRGLLSPLARKNSWAMAEYAGESNPSGMQRLLNSASWDVDGVRDDLRAWTVERIGDAARGVLVPGEMEFRKTGERSVGVHRRYSRAAGRVENAQVGAFVAYAAPKGVVLVDRALYLPKSWTDDPERRRRAGVPDEVVFRTGPQLVADMLEAALDAGVPASWVAAEPGYGDDATLRARLDARGIGYVMAVRASARWSTTGSSEGTVGPPRRPERDGDWVRTSVSEPVADADGRQWEMSMLVWRSTTGRPRPQRFVSRAPAGTSIAELVRVVRTRSAVRKCYERAWRSFGLDQYKVRRYTAWYRHITLSMIADAYVAFQPLRRRR